MTPQTAIPRDPYRDLAREQKARRIVLYVYARGATQRTLDAELDELSKRVEDKPGPETRALVHSLFAEIEEAIAVRRRGIKADNYNASQAARKLLADTAAAAEGWLPPEAERDAALAAQEGEVNG